MAEGKTWTIPDIARPRLDEFDFDLERAMGAVVSLRADVPEDAFTASILGTERIGNGILISDDGLVLTVPAARPCRYAYTFRILTIRK